MSAVSTPVCARCPKVLGTSCCEVAEGEHLATLTRADATRIASATRRRAETFVESEWLSVEEARRYEERRPLYAGYFRRGPERLTLRRRGGACVFLGAEGCVLDEATRPTACLLYPFELWADGTWSLQVDRFGDVDEAKRSRAACLAVEESTAMNQVLAAFDSTREKVEALGAKLKAEVRAHGKG